jgi:hypothetical protein
MRELTSNVSNRFDHRSPRVFSCDPREHCRITVSVMGDFEESVDFAFAVFHILFRAAWLLASLTLESIYSIRSVTQDISLFIFTLKKPLILLTQTGLPNKSLQETPDAAFLNSAFGVLARFSKMRHHIRR